MSEPTPERVRQAKRHWPFSKWHPWLAGVLVGIVLRLIFWDKPENALTPMNFAFLSCAPFAVAAVSVYFAERIERRSWSYYVAIGIGANMLFVLGTMLIMVEGIICAILVFPMFALYGTVGALVMGAICRKTNWPAQAVSGFAVLPLILAGVLPSGPGEVHIGQEQRAILIQATPAQVWRQLHQATAIQAAEVDRAWLYRIGVPLPVSGVTRRQGGQLVRDITMGKNIHFSQVSTDWADNGHVAWTYRFTPESVPPMALDDHVRIGGAYFDLIDTVYTLTPKGNATLLTISIKYRVSTQFNWYARRVAQPLFANFEEVILAFYARRAENQASSISGPSIS
jgi:hypothetical protein